MADPTPEERLFQAIIDKAVAAEMERAAKVDPEMVTCTACFVGPKEACKSIGAREDGGQVHPHTSRHAAAIRAEPADD